MNSFTYSIVDTDSLSFSNTTLDEITNLFLGAEELNTEVEEQPVQLEDADVHIMSLVDLFVEEADVEVEEEDTLDSLFSILPETAEEEETFKKEISEIFSLL